MDTNGTVALVTGAARRVGRAIALAMAQAGCDVAVHYHRSADAAAELAERIRAIGCRATLVAGDLGDPAAPAQIIARTVRDLGRLDILVNNAAIFDPTPMNESEDAAWERIFCVNAIAPARLARAAVPHMREAGQGRIVNLADILADRPIRRYAAYCASKAALANLTRSLARELAPTITVNGVAPGIAVFPDDYDQATRDELVARVPLGRAGTPEEVAAVVRFLVTEADYMTGQILVIDGGRSIVP